METLIEILRKVLADAYAFQLKANNYHWNVEGPNFGEYHDFFAQLYTEVYGVTDSIAEHIRTIGAYSPGSFSRFMELTDIECETSVPSANEMMRRLLVDNEKILATLDIAFKLADKFDKQGLADFLSGRIDAHDKHGWMLRSYLK